MCFWHSSQAPLTLEIGDSWVHNRAAGPLLLVAGSFLTWKLKQYKKHVSDLSSSGRTVFLSWGCPSPGSRPRWAFKTKTCSKDKDGDGHTIWHLAVPETWWAFPCLRCACISFWVILMKGLFLHSLQSLFGFHLFKLSPHSPFFSSPQYYRGIPFPWALSSVVSITHDLKVLIESFRYK